MNYVIEQDTREKDAAAKRISSQLENEGFKVIRTKLYVGDYRLLDNPYKVIERKKDLSEICGNVCSKYHARFKAELSKANELGIKVCILIEHGENINRLEDIKKWNNPNAKKYPNAPNGERLYKTLDTIRWRYDVDFVFCNKFETGKKIVEILEDKQCGD